MSLRVCHCWTTEPADLLHQFFSHLSVRRAVNCEEDLKLGFEDDIKKCGANNQCVDADDEFKGLPLLDDRTTDKMIFVYRSHSMERLYQRYGKHLELLEATYETTKYALPLYFLVVQAKVNYQVRWCQVESFTEL